MKTRKPWNVTSNQAQIRFQLSRNFRFLIGNKQPELVRLMSTILRENSPKEGVQNK